MPKGDSKRSKGKGPVRRPTARRPTARHHNPESEDDTPEQSRPSRMIRPSTASRKGNIHKHHTDMVSELSEMFSLKSKEWCAICSKVEMMQYLSTNDMGDVKDMFGLCIALKKKGIINYGEYSKLREILVTCDVEAGETIDKFTKMIRGESEGGFQMLTPGTTTYNPLGYIQQPLGWNNQACSRPIYNYGGVFPQQPQGCPGYALSSGSYPQIGQQWYPFPTPYSGYLQSPYPTSTASTGGFQMLTPGTTTYNPLGYIQYPSGCYNQACSRPIYNYGGVFPQQPQGCPGYALSSGSYPQIGQQWYPFLTPYSGYPQSPYPTSTASTEGNDLPVEILQMDQQSIQLYQKCLEEKEEEDYHLRVIVIGQTGAGKTTLTRNLLRLPQIPHTESTDGVDIHNSFVNRDDKDWITDADLQNAGKCLDAKLIQSLKRTASNNTGADPNTEGDKSAQTASRSDDVSFSSSEYDNDDQQNAGIARLIQSLDSTASKNTGADPDDLQNLGPSTPANEPVLKKTLTDLLKGSSSDRDYTMLGELCVWDFAGQFEFYTTHHTFLTHRAVYLLVTRLDQNINDTVDNDQCFLDATGCKEMKIKDFVSYWMNSVHLYSGAAEHLPPVILVGTHLDKVEGDREKKKTSHFEDIRRYLLDMKSPTLCHLIDTDYAVSNPPDELEIGNLRQKIVDLASKQTYWGEKIPDKWITLEKALMGRKIEGVNIMSYDNVVELDKSTGVPIDDQDKLDLFLRFQHAKGNMIYFSEGCMRDHIVLNPQWLIDAFKCIITARQFCIKYPSLPQHWEALHTTGKLYLDMVDDIFKKEELCQHKEHILGLMERLHIISHHVVDKDDDKSNTSEEFYFVPSLLKDKVTECEIENYVKGTNGTPYLCYIFENNFLPTAVFHRLIAACLSEYTVAKQGSKFLIFCGCGIFDLNGGGLTHLVVAFYDNIIQIGLFRLSEEGCAPETSTCVLVRQFVTETLERVLRRYDMKLPFTLNLKCEKSPLLSHEGLLSVDDVITGGKEVVCHGHEKKRHIINRDSLLHLWFPDKVSATDPNQGVDRFTSGNNFRQPGAIPNEKLLRISTKIGKEFKALARYLGLTEAEIDKIQLDYPHNTGEQIYQILVRWTQKSGPHATEQCLRKALRHSEIDVEILTEPEISGACL